LGVECIGHGFLVYDDRNTSLILFNTSCSKTNIYPEGVAMFSLFKLT